MTENDMLEQIIPESVSEGYTTIRKKDSQTEKKQKLMEKQFSEISEEVFNLKEEVKSLKSLLKKLNTEVEDVSELKGVDFGTLVEKIEDIDSAKFERSQLKDSILKIRERVSQEIEALRKDLQPTKLNTSEINNKLEIYGRKIQSLERKISERGSTFEEFEKKFQFKDINDLVSNIKDDAAKVEEIKGYMVSKSQKIDTIRDHIDQLSLLREDLDSTDELSKENSRKISDMFLGFKRMEALMLQNKILMFLNGLPYIKNEVLMGNIVDTISEIINELGERGEWDYDDKAFIEEFLKNLIEDERIVKSEEEKKLYQRMFDRLITIHK
ncbi:MAG: hypothetical protein GF368_01970 [Candidatus Aenigmarchaeota archaeon]|nr:hypothetical protein [Candidatus Aenigmarchaeota archaeon]